MKNEWYYERAEFKNDYSSLVSGHLDYRFIKGDREIVWGLNEVKKPPTLVWPRPWDTDDETNQNLLKLSNEEIYKLIWKE